MNRRTYKPIVLQWTIRHFRLSLLLFTCATFQFYFNAISQEIEPIGFFANIIGKAEVLREGKSIPATKDLKIYETDTIVTADKTAIKIVFNDGSNIMAFQDSRLKVSEYKSKARENQNGNIKSSIDIIKGKVRFFVKPNESGKVDAKFKSSNAVMGIRGTSGFIDTTSPNNTQIIITTGTVEVTSLSDPSKSVIVGQNKFTEVLGNRAPSTPKVVPPVLLNRLNLETTAVDPNYKLNEQSTPKPDGTPQKKDENPSKGSNDPPPPAQKKMVITPDGSTVVVSTNPTLNDVLTSQGNPQLRPQNFADIEPISNALKEVNNLNTSINNQINNIIDTSTGFQKTKSINIMVKSPQLP